MADMWTLINREIAKQEEAERGIPDTSYAGVVKEALGEAKEERVWKERKNAQMQKMMDLQVEGYQTNFGEADIKKKQDRLQQYISRNQGSMNDMTLEYADLLKENIKTHGEKVGKFKEDVDMLEANRETWLLKADDYFSRDQGTDPLNATDYGDIQDSIDDYVRMKNEMLENNADFLQLPAYKHVLTNMVGQEAVINDLLKEAKDGGVFSEYERDYLKQALKTGDYSIIEEERAKKKTLTAELMKSYVTGPEGVEIAYDKNELYKKLDKGESITVPEGEIIAGFQAGNTFSKKSLNEDELELLLDESADVEDDLNRKNKIYETNTGNSYIFERGGVSDKVGFKDDEIKIFKDHFGMTDDEIELMSSRGGKEKLNEYGQETGIAKYKTDKGKDDSSALSNIATGLVLTGAFAHATGIDQKAVEISKQVLGVTKEAISNVKHIAKNVPLEDIATFLDDPVIAEAVEDLSGLKEEMEAAKESGEYSKEYKKAKRAYDLKVKQHANSLKTGGRIKVTYDPKGGIDPKTGKPFKMKGTGKRVTRAIKSFNVTELQELLTNPNKWHTLKIKRKALKIMPGLAKGWKTLKPGGGFASFELGRRAAREFAEKMFGEGLGSELAGVAGGVVTQKYAYNTAKKKISEKLATAAGKRWLFKKIAKVATKRIATAALTGVAAGGGTPLSAATGLIGTLVGTGMAIWDVMEIFEIGPYSEKGEE